jgi:hypothetical protein
MLISETLTSEYAAAFEDLTFEELDATASSFKFENCTQRKQLNEVLEQSHQQ